MTGTAENVCEDRSVNRLRIESHLTAEARRAASRRRESRKECEQCVSKKRTQGRTQRRGVMITRRGDSKNLTRKDRYLMLSHRAESNVS